MIAAAYECETMLCTQSYSDSGGGGSVLWLVALAAVILLVWVLFGEGA